jgi:hypothetical protein
VCGPESGCPTGLDRFSSGTPVYSASRRSIIEEFVRVKYKLFNQVAEVHSDY